MKVGLTPNDFSSDYDFGKTGDLAGAVFASATTKTAIMITLLQTIEMTGTRCKSSKTFMISS